MPPFAKCGLVFALLLFLSRGTPAADSWFAANAAGVITVNDCGQVGDTTGTPVVKRSPTPDAAPGMAIFASDRLYADDVLEVPAGGLLEWTCGRNVIVTLGPESSVRLLGHRTLTAADGTRMSRLDAQLLKGELRAQVRLNRERPETLLVEVGHADVLLSRGDVRIGAGPEGGVAILAGDAGIRVRRPAGMEILPPLPEGKMLDANLQPTAGAADAEAIRRRLPFSFEKARAALPPLPAASQTQDAP